MTAEDQRKRLVAMKDVLLAIGGLSKAENAVLITDTLWVDKYTTVLDRLVCAAHTLGATPEQIREAIGR